MESMHFHFELEKRAETHLNIYNEKYCLHNLVLSERHISIGRVAFICINPRNERQIVKCFSFSYVIKVKEYKLKKQFFTRQ